MILSTELIMRQYKKHYMIIYRHNHRNADFEDMNNVMTACASLAIRLIGR